MRHRRRYIYPVKFAAPFGVFNPCSTQRAPVFTPETLLYPAFIRIYPFLFRYSGNPLQELYSRFF
jgi:hypothetical protein